MANFNFKEMSDTYYDELRMLQNDPKFKDTCENSKLAIIIVDLADWLDYVIEGHKVYN